MPPLGFEQHAAWLNGLVNAARQQPDGQIVIRDEHGAVVATVQSHSLATRPKDMPRALRPRQKLSKRQRAAARASKRDAAAAPQSTAGSSSS